MNTSLSTVAFQFLSCREAKCLRLWFDDIENRFGINTISAKTTYETDDVCDFAFSFINFDINITTDYVEFTLKGHRSEYFTIYCDEFFTFTFR